MVNNSNDKYVENLTMKEIIQKLLDSELSAYKIGKSAGVQDSLVKKLRNGDQEIGATKYENLEKMADFAKRSGILLQDIHDPNEVDVKLHKSVMTFIEDIKSSLAYINSANKKSIDKVYVYDEYHLNEHGDSVYKTSYIEIDNNILVPISSKGLGSDEWIPYNINIRNEIQNTNHINDIKQLRLTFNSEQLINDLVSEEKKGNRVKMNGSMLWRNNKTRTISVYDVRNNTEILGYESSYFDIRYKVEKNNEERGD